MNRRLQTQAGVRVQGKSAQIQVVPSRIDELAPDMCRHMRAGVHERQSGHQCGHQDQRLCVQHASAVVQRGHDIRGQQQHSARSAKWAAAGAIRQQPPDFPGGPPRVEQPGLHCGECAKTPLLIYVFCEL